MDYVPSPPAATQQVPQPQPTFGGGPRPTPVPPSNPQSSADELVSPESSLAAVTGPFATQFSGGYEDACSPILGESHGGQPIDVAADVSSNQIVELLDSGIWVFDKQGTVQTGFPQSLNTFWSSNPLRSADCLTDTQIAYEPIAKRWIATTLCDTTNDGDLYVAISNTSDATKGWKAYNIPSICSTTEPATPQPDQPSLGYNQNWVAIDTLCINPGVAFGSDQIILIPHSTLTQNPLPQTLLITVPSPGSVPIHAARPSRDVSGNAAQNLFLVGSVIPSDSNLPFVEVTAIDASGKYAPPGPSSVNNGIVSSPGNGVLGKKTESPAQHDDCGSGAACDVDLGDERIQTVVLQTGNDGNHYLLTSFHAGDRANDTAQALWFVGKVDSFATTSQWNGSYVDGSSFSGAYPTITMDNDLDIASTFQSFFLNSNIYPNWYIDKGFVPNDNNFALNPPNLGYGIVGNPNRSAYYGWSKCSPPGNPPQKWGDFMSTIWDANLGSPNEGSGFWTVQEYSNGGPTPTSTPSSGPTPVPLGSNQSTQFTKLADPLPYFVGPESNVESECTGGTGSTCDVTVHAPPGVQNGDVILVAYALGEPATHPGTLPDSTSWTLLTASNISGTPSQISAKNSSGTITAFLAAHIFGSVQNDSGSYTFKHVINSPTELFAFLMTYRGAGQSLGKYTAYGFSQNGFSNSFMTSASVTPPAESQLITMTAANIGCDESTEPSDTFAAPSGSPTLAAETPLTLASGTFPWLGSDVGAPITGQAFGPYTYGITSSGRGCSTTGIWLSWEVAVPE